MRGREWTPRDTETLTRMSALYHSDEEIAKATGNCRRTVQRQRSAGGLETCPKLNTSGRLMLRHARRLRAF